MSDSSGEKVAEQAGMGHPLHPVPTSGSITVTPEMFERMYLGPQNNVKGDLRKTFGNPTPVGLGGFLLAYCPLIIEFMGWRGSGGQGIPTVGTYYFFGGLLAVLACVGEWVLGNSFPSTFFGVYGGFFLYYGATLTPYFNASGDGGSMGPIFLSSNAFVALFMSLFSLYCTICALRVNVLFVIAFGLLTPAFSIFAAAEWYGAQGEAVKAENYMVAAGAVGFPVAIVGWYLLLVIMLSTVDFPLTLPVGDLSTFIRSGTEIAKEKRRKREQNGTSA